MTTIRATCPRCGEVEMGAAAVLLTVEAGRAEGSYSFVCPVCEQTIEKRADRKVVMLLLSAGVEVQEVGQTAQKTVERPRQATLEEALPPDPQPEGPPLTVDDLIDFHFLLEDDSWLEDLANAGE